MRHLYVVTHAESDQCCRRVACLGGGTRWAGRSSRAVEPGVHPCVYVGEAATTSSTEAGEAKLSPAVCRAGCGPRVSSARRQRSALLQQRADCCRITHLGYAAPTAVA